jgi:hypothetical protein
MSRLFALAAAAVVTAAQLFGCQTIAGIKDHVFSSNPDCEQYCDLVQSKCDAGAFSSIYLDRPTCLGVCGQIDPNPELVGNTLGCRENALNSGERSECARAGPGGGGTCGSNCQSYCALFDQVCTAQFSTDFGGVASARSLCEAKCKTLPDKGSFDVVTDYSGNTLQCRLAHVSTATTVTGPEHDLHCGHADLRSTDNCIDDPQNQNGDFCARFCAFNLSACATASVYENLEQCQRVCEAFPAGSNSDSVQNTRACRLYHTYNALLVDTSHCSHTSAGGDGHCGPDDADAGTGNCESYCRLLQVGCKEKFDQTFTGADKQAECEATCGTLPGAARDTGYNVKDAGGGTLQCRLLFLSRALEHPDAGAAFCASAFGENADCR